MKDKEDIKDTAEPKTTDNTKQQSSGESDKGLAGDEGVVVSEEYQKKAHDLTHKATKHHLDHLRGRINNREDEMRKEEMKKDKPLGKGSVKEFDSEGY